MWTPMATVALALIAGTLVACGQGAAQPGQSAGSPTAAEANAAMGHGFNLGNTFDTSQHPSDLEAIQPLIDLYAEAGMRHVRIPVTWGGEVRGSALADRQGKLDLAHPRLKQLEAAVDYALSKGLYVVVNAHHEHWLKEGYDGSAAYDDAFRALWTGIAGRFRDRSPKLIFEVLNEPENAFGDWSGPLKPHDPKAIARTRRINEIGYEAIRATGGANATRIVLVGTNGQGNHSMLDEVYPDPASLPGGGQDGHLIATVHTYDPWDFCGQDGSNDKWPGEEAIAAPIRAVAAHARKLGIPVNYGEFGVGRDKNPNDRDADVVRAYYRTVVQTAGAEGMSTTVWDDRGWFGLTARNDDGTYRFVRGIVPAMLRP